MMTSVLSIHRLNALRPLLALLLAACALLAGPAHADRAFSQRFSANVNGDLVIIGNAQLSCTTGVANCATARAGGAYNNNDFTMTNVDIDSDASTFNSTSANLSMPAGSTVIFAGLYWSGQTTDASRSQVLLKTPTSFGYSIVNASVLDTSSGNTYQAFRDVTAQVNAAGSGTYTVANVATATGNTNYQAGWSLVIVYQNNSLPLRNHTVFDGLVYVSNTTITLPISGFLTPLTGPITTKLGSVNYDGDYNTTGDRLRLNGTDLTDALNPINNFYNSTIADGGTYVTTRNPSYSNTLGMDIDRVNVPAGILGNGATSATIQITSPSAGEVFWQGVASFMTDLYVPIITPNIIKTGEDLNGGSLVTGDTLRWRIYMKNTGIDSGTNLSLSDPIPANLAYKPGTLAITKGANIGAKTDGSGDDQAEYISSGTPRVVFRLGTGANASAGGNLAYNQETELTFDTTVNPGLPSGTPITNTASISYSGQTIPDQFAGSGAAADTVVLVPPTITKAFTPNVIDVGAAAVLSFVVSNPASNPGNVTGAAFLDTYPSGMVNAATPNAQVVCTPGSSGTLQGGAAGGNTIGLTNATIPPNGNCTVSVNVTAATSGNYTNTSAALTTTNAGTGTTATATLSVGKPSISKSFTPTSIISGGTSVLSVTLTNTGAAALSNVAFSDPLPNMRVAATPGVSNTCGGTVSAAAAATTVSLSGGSLAGGASCTISVNVTSTTTGVHVNIANGVTSTQTGSAGNPSNAATLTVIGAPVLSKSFDPVSVDQNATSVLTITVSNPNTTTTLTGVAFSDVYPSTNLRNQTPASPTLNCTSGATATRTGGADGTTTPTSGIGITSGSLPPGGSCTVTVNVEGTAAADYVNTTSTATSSNGGTGATASATLNVTGLTRTIDVAKSFSPTTIAANATSTLTILLRNNNTSAVNGVSFVDSYPTGLVNAATPALTNTCGGTATAVAGGSSLSLSGGTIPARPGNNGTFGTCTITVAVTSADSGVYSNTTGTVLTSNGGTIAESTAALTVLAPPVITKSFNPVAVAVNGTSLLTLTLSNPTTAAVSLTGVGVVDPYPTNLVNTAAPGGATTCSGGTVTAAAGGSSLTLAGATMAPNTSCTVTVNVRSGTAGSYTNTTNAVTTTNAGTGGTAQAVLSVGRPSLAKSFAPTTIAANGTAVLTLTLSNPTGTAMNTATVTDTYPGGMTNTATPSAATTCAGGTPTAAANGGSVSLSGGTIPANGSCTLTVNVTAGGTLTNTVPAGALTVNSGSASSATAASATLLVYDTPAVTKAFNPTVIVPGGSSSQTITVSNANNVDATGLAFTDTFPAGLTLANTTTSNGCGGTLQGRTNAGAWGAVATGNTEIRLTGGSLLANSTCVVTVNVTSATAGNYLNSTGAVTTGNIGSGSAATATLTVMASPTVAKSFSPSSVLVNEVSVLTVTLTNSNTVAITGAAFTDTYPAGLVNDTTPNVTSSCGTPTLAATAGGNSVALSGASIPASGSCTVTIRVRSASAGSYPNTISAVSTTNAGDSAAANATLSVSQLMPALVLDKISTPFSDPVNLTSNPKYLPGAVATYRVRLSNTGPGTPDSNTIIVSDHLPPQVELYVGDLGGPGTGPVLFTDGTPSSGLTWTYTALGNTSDSLDFSTDGVDWTYPPVPDVNGYDPLVRYLRFKPAGAMPAAGGSNPSTDFTFRVRLK